MPLATTAAGLRGRRSSASQYPRIVGGWADKIGADGVRAAQLLVGHSKLESTVRYLGLEVEDALELAEQTDA